MGTHSAKWQVSDECSLCTRNVLNEIREEFLDETRKELINLYFFNMRLGSKRLIAGIGYWRSIEYPTGISNLELKKDDTILDIGSGLSPFPIFLASKGYSRKVCLVTLILKKHIKMEHTQEEIKKKNLGIRRAHLD